MRHVPFAAFAILLTTAAATPAAIKAPDGWTVVDLPGGTAYVAPGVPADQAAAVLVRPTQPLAGALRPWFDQSVAALRGSDALVLGGQIEGSRTAGGVDLLSADEVAKHDGRYVFRKYVAAGAAGKAELVCYSANSAELLEKFEPQYRQILAAWREDRLAAAEKQVAADAQNPLAQPRAAAPQQPAAAPAGKTQPKAGFITGTALAADGRPVAGALFHVEATGTTLRGGERTWFEIPVKPDGTFEQRVPDGLYRVTCELKMDYAGTPVTVPLEADDAQPQSARLDSTAGIAKDFRFRTHGLKIGGDKNNLYHYLGGAVGLHTERNRLAGGLAGTPPVITARHPGASYELTLTPNGPLMDGSKGERLVYRFGPDWLGDGFGKPAKYYLDIPLGRYTAAVALVGPNGARAALKMNVANDPGPDRDAVDVLVTSGTYLPIYLVE
ncbi:MAG TPA: hypothetical protein VF796_03635 [Humisphaera sp.]